MGIVSGFQYDLFISYAHANNQDVSDKQRGWVTELHDELSKALWQEMRAKPEIWRDEGGLDGKQVHGAIREAVESSAVFLAVVSRSYLDSQYCCDKELRSFVEYKHPVFPLVLRNHKRVVAVVYDSEPDCPRSGWSNTWSTASELVDAPCATFCVTDSSTSERRRYWKPLRRDPDPYWTEFDRLVRHLCAIFTEMRKGASGNADVAPLVPASAAPVAKPATAWIEAREKQAGRNLVYIPYCAADPAQLKEELKRRRFELAVLDHGSNKPIDKRHAANLRFCDGMVVVYGGGVVEWAESLAHEARMFARDQGRPKGLGVMPGPGGDSDFGLVTDFIVMLEENDNGSIAGLDDFLARLTEASS